MWIELFLVADMAMKFRQLSAISLPYKNKIEQTEKKGFNNDEN